LSPTSTPPLLRSYPSHFQCRFLTFTATANSITTRTSTATFPVTSPSIEITLNTIATVNTVTTLYRRLFHLHHHYPTPA
jgi:hypothetical protein